MRISDCSSDVCSSDLGALFDISVSLCCPGGRNRVDRQLRLNGTKRRNKFAGKPRYRLRKDDLARWCADQSLKLARAGFDTEDVDRNQVVRVAWYRRYVDVGVARVSGRHSIFHGCGTASEERGDGTKCDFYSSFGRRSEEHTSELQSLMRISYAVFCLKK